MPKEKNKIKQKKNNYFNLAIGIFISVVIILTIGRVNSSKYLGLIFSIVFGDYSIIILLFILAYAIFSLIFNYKFDFYHIYFIGIFFIYLGLSLFSHLNIYDNLSSDNLFLSSINLYYRYLKSYDFTYSTGGGIIGTILSFIVFKIFGRIGVILLSIAFILIGVSYLLKLDLLNLLKGGKLKTKIKQIFVKTNNYFSNIHFSEKNVTIIKPSILSDTNEPINFTLQEEINKEILNELKKFIIDNKLNFICDSYYTSYTSSRFVLKALGPCSVEQIKRVKYYFNKSCFVIKNNNEYNIELSNSFKKLLTLKSMLAYNERTKLAIAYDISNKPIIADFTVSKLIVLCGDFSTGIKTFVRCFISSLGFIGINPNNIFLFDLYKEYEECVGKINYFYTEKDIYTGLDNGFNEYERRSETLRYLSADNIVEANKKIKELDKKLNILENQFYIISINPKMVSDLFYSKITYLIKFGLRVGINILLEIRDVNVLSKINIENGDIISFYLSDISSSIKLFGSDISSRLQKNGDMLYQSKSGIKHGQAPYISLDDFNNVIKNF